MSGPRNVTVPDGATARLHCDVEGSPDNFTVDWHSDAGVVASTSEDTWPVDDVPRRFGVDRETASLTVLNVSRQDAGTYTCAAHNDLGATAAARAYINVTCKLFDEFST